MKCYDTFLPSINRQVGGDSVEPHSANTAVYLNIGLEFFHATV